MMKKLVLILCILLSAGYNISASRNDTYSNFRVYKLGMIDRRTYYNAQYEEYVDKDTMYVSRSYTPKNSNEEKELAESLSEIKIAYLTFAAHMCRTHNLSDSFTGSNTDVMNFLLSKNPNLQNDSTMKYLLAKNPDFYKSSIVRFILSNDPNLQNPAGISYLHLASYLNDRDKVYILIKRGANVNLKDNAGQTPLHAVAHHICGSLGSYEEVVSMLLDAGADINHQDETGRTALHYASIGFYKFDVVKLLIEKKANLSLQDGNGRTPLHYANPINLKLFMKARADSTIKDMYGRTPRELFAYEKTNGSGFAELTLKQFDQESAAIKIQALRRGFIDRQKIKDNKVGNSSLEKRKLIEIVDIVCHSSKK